MTYLITGATGLIGSRIVNKLMEKGGANVIAHGRSATKLERIFSRYLPLENFYLFAHDISEPFRFGTLSEETGGPIDAVFHAASPISGAIIRTSPLDVIWPNLMGTRCILEGLAEQKRATGVDGRAVIFSSATVYGKITDADITASEADTVYADPLEDVNAAYSESKRMTEVIARGYIKQYGVDVVIARPSYVYGGAYFPPNTAIFEFFSNAISGEDINLTSSGAARRDNIYVDDAVSGLFTILKKGRAGEAYNISSGGELGNYAAIDEIAEAIANASPKAVEANISVNYNAPASGSRKPGIILDNSKLKALGWELTTGLEEGMEKSLREQFLILGIK